MSSLVERDLSARDLARLPREPVLPFRLTLETASFVIVDVLRHLPGRRLTVMIEDSVRGPGVLKLFFGPNAERDFRRARRGQDGFLKAGVETTPLVAECAPAAVDAGTAWLLFQHLSGAVHAGAADAVRLSEILGHIHHHGLSHTDLHLGNFLKVADGRLICIDGDALEQKLLSLRAGLEELAILLAQFDIPEQPDIDTCLRAYAKGREEGVDERQLTVLHRRIERLLKAAIHRRSKHYLRKTLRDCTNFEVWEQSGSRCFCRREVAAAFGPFATDPESFFGADAKVLKPGNSATVIGFESAGKQYVAKRYNITGLGQRLRRIFRRRARDAWQNGLRLGFLGIPAAVPLGLVETGSRWWPGPAYLLMERLTGKDLATLTASGHIDSFTLKDLVGILAALQRAELTHGDFKSTNFVLHDQRLHLIDFDAVRVSKRGLASDVRRLLDNWGEDVPARRVVAKALREAGLRGVPAGRI